MSTREWEKVLWKTQPYPDNYIPERYFLSSLRKNRECQCFIIIESGIEKINGTANFRPYTYWPLVLASCSITQHLSTIYIFLATFVRLKDRSLDARVLVWIAVACFLGGYTTWELLDRTQIDRAQRTINRAYLSIEALSN